MGYLVYDIDNTKVAAKISVDKVAEWKGVILSNINQDDLEELGEEWEQELQF